MRVAFWNINAGKNSVKDRVLFIDFWLKYNHVDLVFLEEVNATYASKAALNTLSSDYVCVGLMINLNKNAAPTNCIAALAHKTIASDFELLRQTAVRNQSVLPKRGILRIRDKKRDVVFYGIHANASDIGGKAAIWEVAPVVLKYDKRAVIGGDFNCSINEFNNNNDTSVTHPNGYSGAPLEFTQWSRSSPMKSSIPDGQGNRVGIVKEMHSDTHLNWRVDTHRKIYTQSVNPTPKGVIDFAISKGVNLDAQKCCQSINAWQTILRLYDHCPVVYDVT